MKKKGFIISFLIFIGIGIILIIFDENVAGIISLGFASMLFFTYLTTLIMEKRKINQLDDVYYVLKKEELLKEYNKLAAEFDNEKLKAISLVYLEFKEEYSQEELKRFGLWLTQQYNADPSGLDEGIVILFVNIHDMFMKELLKHIKKQLKEENIKVDFNFGYANYKFQEDYEDLKARAIKNLEGKIS